MHVNFFKNLVKNKGRRKILEKNFVGEAHVQGYGSKKLIEWFIFIQNFWLFEIIVPISSFCELCSVNS